VREQAVDLRSRLTKEKVEMTVVARRVEAVAFEQIVDMIAQAHEIGSAVFIGHGRWVRAGAKMALDGSESLGAGRRLLRAIGPPCRFCSRLRSGARRSKLIGDSVQAARQVRVTHCCFQSCMWPLRVFVLSVFSWLEIVACDAYPEPGPFEVLDYFVGRHAFQQRNGLVDDSLLGAPRRLAPSRFEAYLLGYNLRA
jgi:hypothetical protein